MNKVDFLALDKRLVKLLKMKCLLGDWEICVEFRYIIFLIETSFSLMFCGFRLLKVPGVSIYSWIFVY